MDSMVLQLAFCPYGHRSGRTSSLASTTILYGEPFPDSDDDGDGFGNDGDFIDCDDTNSEVYPGAAEIVDGLDNDCDNQIDERTPAGMTTETLSQKRKATATTTTVKPIQARQNNQTSKTTTVTVRLMKRPFGR